MNHKSNNSASNPESQLESGIVAIVEQPLDRAAIERVKARAKDQASVSVADRQARPTSARSKRLVWGSAVAASIAMVFVTVSLFSSSNSAFAAAIEKLRSAEYLSFVMVIESNFVGKGGPDQPAIAPIKSQVYVAADGRFRFETDGMEIIAAEDSKSAMMIDHNEKQCSVVEYGDEDINHMRWFETLKSQRSNSVKELGNKTIAAKKVEGYVVQDEDDEITIWIDVETDQLVQVELEQSANSVQVKMLMNNFHYDVQLDESTFKQKPPADYELIEAQDPMEFFESMEQDFIDGLKYFVEQADGAFPESLDATRFYSAPPEQITMKFSSSLTGIEVLKSVCKEKGYLGAGKKVGEPRSIVFWYRDLEAGKLRAIWSDFTASEIEESQLPEVGKP